MKKIFSIILIASLLCSMLVLPSEAADATVNSAITAPFLEKSPIIDGVVDFNEYGSFVSIHSLSANGDQFTDDLIHNSKEYIDDINFYAGWTEDTLYMAWVVSSEIHTPFVKGTYTMEDGAYYATIVDDAWPETEAEQDNMLTYMWYYSCVQFLIIPGVPNCETTDYISTKDYLHMGFCQMDDGEIGKTIMNLPEGIEEGTFGDSNWDASVVRDDLNATTVYEVAIPAEMCGVEKFEQNVSIGLGYAVASQEHYYEKGASMIEWQDSILSWPTKPDNAGVLTLVPSQKQRLRGDVNGDNAVDKKDYSALKRYCFEAMTFDSESMLAADVNNDGVVDKKDYSALKRHCFGTYDIPNSVITINPISRGMEYSYPQNNAGTHGVRGYTGNVTDGIVPTSFELTSDWFGLFNNVGAVDETNAIQGFGDFVFDLEKATPLAEVRVANGNDGSFRAPEISVAVSDNGFDWTEIYFLDPGQNISGIVWYSGNLEGVTAQYVRVRVTCPAETYWAFIAEIEIYAQD